ncbi:TetR/AcrR family transcriptional regulator [Rhodococcus sp. 15-725-2-2b]|jgi:AcrR family transcriptional regulator|uniref:TetR/AcrR family transcriptional regulator n=1 Tax=unclassified Rhodococcus (in: high G+C Gram-positive bacteria) TaxID=192944 RepID=UPI0005EB2168|nr:MULTISPECIES: TetR/AcrR family transcriptional regulator [unclassified Rhodococcus (in: high G+C Gram-positive bacteria)]OZC62551.1 TetR/AcrR family transcriptional regulator [Rhodococcus sp. 06-469-3-2]OZC67834.1 TetR/AcrR family transcriptional regulator [Rhodococcus sp. 06-470-2]OZC81178.1 TetR/AcrR family transcriptional regulator [Rhodococcus sp. 06-418-5]OZD50059.1 TetR/AcrR family transcriptional regulator [Rhodococcus sp. 06-1477-1A]OZE06867.1 TetR/AcrR family transcriptional regula
MSVAVKVDGRSDRWREHRITRRRELLDRTLAAIREHGHDVGMDAIASANGVSKTVLYKHFTDKKGLADAAMARYVETALMPRIQDAMSEDLDEYRLTRAVIGAYVTTVATDPDIYIYVHANNAVSGNQEIITAAEGLIADLLATVIIDRFGEREFSTAGSMPIAFAMIGAVRLASHWWIFDRTMTADELVDYLTMMVWGGIAGIARAAGSAATFTSEPHSLTLEG